MFETLQIEFKPKQQIFYALYLPKYEKSYILNDYIETDHIRKGRACECKKFSTKEEAEEWIRKWKIGEFKQTPKKNFYGIYFINEKAGVICKSPEKVNQILYKVPAYCKKFYAEEEAQEWIDIMVLGRARYFAVFYPGEKNSFITKDPVLFQEFTKDRVNINQIFETSIEADSWIKTMENNYDCRAEKYFKNCRR